jgi:PAS domain S-box-containing protein
MPHARFPVPLKNFVLGIRRADLPRPLWALCNAYPLRGRDGAIEQVFVTFVDVTERKEAGDELRLLGAAISHLNDVVMITDAGTLDAPGPHIVFVNEAFERVTGWLREEAIGQSPRMLQGPKTDAAQLARIGQALRRHEAVHAELINYTKQGAEYWIEFDIVPLLDMNGRVTHHVAIERDITERKRAEQERAGLEQQLREAQKMESIGTLAGGIAHDFNNILAAILGNVALAREDAAAGQPVQSSLEQINRAGLRARNLVQQILAFSRRDQLGFSSLALAPVIHETLALLRATIPAGVQLNAVVPEAPLNVRGNSTQLQQVLMNLCTNAWHALPDQGGRVEVGVERTSVLHPDLTDVAPGDWVHLWVSDNGKGMDDATRQRMFDPFFTTKAVGEGTGLGLSVVHGIVRAHEGAIAVDTALAVGTTFHLYFPAREPDAAASALTPAAGAAARGAGQRVMYVDDDEVMVVLVDSLLQRAGFRVSVSTDATAAVAQVRAQPQAFDVVVTDFNMPRLSGLEVARQVAQIRPDLPVVLSSGYVSESLRAQALKAGVRSLLQKENTFEELVDLLQCVLASEAG